MTKFKVCLMGAFSVGKSSLVRRFVHEVFDDRYITTLGVKIETKQVQLDSGPVKMVVWDMGGADGADQDADLVSSRMKAYLQGVNGVMLVADGTRSATVDTAQRLHEWLKKELPGVPAVMLLNKFDLQEQWQLSVPETKELFNALQCFTTSALSGENVERTFKHLAEVLGDKE